MPTQSVGPLSKRQSNGAATLALLAASCSATLALAYPEGAPWGAADPGASEHCASCHWERDAVEQSESIMLQGLPALLTAGEQYSLQLTLEGTTFEVSGLQVIAMIEQGTAGTFAPGDDDAETSLHGTAIRSTAVRANEDGSVRWQFDWRAPIGKLERITFLIAASAANNDQSPFGDQIHYREISVPAAPD